MGEATRRESCLFPLRRFPELPALHALQAVPVISHMSNDAQVPRQLSYMTYAHYTPGNRLISKRRKLPGQLSGLLIGRLPGFPCSRSSAGCGVGGTVSPASRTEHHVANLGLFRRWRVPYASRLASMPVLIWVEPPDENLLFWPVNPYSPRKNPQISSAVKWGCAR
jgi:hypothetical protein